MKKSLTFITIFSILLFTAAKIYAFDWPQNNSDDTSIKSYFGQKRGNTISSSLIFSDPEEVKCIEDGRVLILMLEEDDDSVFFPSTLGNSTIIAHDDSLLSVYGNFDKDSLHSNLQGKTKIEAQDVLGQPSNSGWQASVSSLEFQIIDTKNGTAINPKILIPRTKNELPLTLSGITLENKAGTKYELSSRTNFSSGLYRIYQKRNLIASPYKTTVTINGVVVDQISYDLVNQENNKIYVTGKKKYLTSEIYPDNNLQLLGETMLTAGRITLGISVVDFLGKQTQNNYIINVY
ncbi:MAG: hypothetical protein MJ188_09000 [Treponema sp.]|nr:hypothetical protein [Treponema sp.]